MAEITIEDLKSDCGRLRDHSRLQDDVHGRIDRRFMAKYPRGLYRSTQHRISTSLKSFRKAIGVYKSRRKDGSRDEEEDDEDDVYGELCSSAFFKRYMGIFTLLRKKYCLQSYFNSLSMQSLQYEKLRQQILNSLISVDPNCLSENSQELCRSLCLAQTENGAGILKVKLIDNKLNKWPSQVDSGNIDVYRKCIQDLPVLIFWDNIHTHDNLPDLTQDCKDISRDVIKVNGEVLEGTCGYERIVRRVSQLLESCYESGSSCVPNKCVRQSMLLLHLLNRTLTGGMCLEKILRVYDNPDIAFCVPDSKFMSPLEMNVLSLKLNSTETKICDPKTGADGISLEQPRFVTETKLPSPSGLGETNQPEAPHNELAKSEGERLFCDIYGTSDLNALSENFSGDDCGVTNENVISTEATLTDVTRNFGKHDNLGLDSETHRSGCRESENDRKMFSSPTVILTSHLRYLLFNAKSVGHEYHAQESRTDISTKREDKHFSAIDAYFSTVIDLEHYFNDDFLQSVDHLFPKFASGNSENNEVNGTANNVENHDTNDASIFKIEEFLQVEKCEKREENHLPPLSGKFKTDNSNPATISCVEETTDNKFLIPTCIYLHGEVF